VTWLAPRLVHMCVTWLIHMCDMVQVHTTTWLFDMCDMTCSYLWRVIEIGRSHVTHIKYVHIPVHNSSHASQNRKKSCHTYQNCLICVTWLLPMTHVTSYCRHMNESCHTHNEPLHIYAWVMSHIWMSHVTHIMSHCTYMHESCHTYEWVMSRYECTRVSDGV